MLLPELLSPAGNREKLEAAIRYGADAVYLAGRRFGMRAASDNFTLEELADAVAYAHSFTAPRSARTGEKMPVKIYLTVNIMPRGYEYAELTEYFKALRNIPIDALIISDLGVLSLARELLPETEIHISTQASAVSAPAVSAYAALGAKRVVLARELSLGEIREIRRGIPPETELEAFVHGSMCVSYSGLCLLSEHLVGRDANRGCCTQPCRWNWALSDNISPDAEGKTYEIQEKNHRDENFPIAEDEYGTFIMSARDMCMIEHIPELCEAGIDCFKIEGRVKSAYYTAVVTNAYRIAIDSYADGLPFDNALRREVESVSHRDFGTGHFFGKAHVTEALGYLREKAYLAAAGDDCAAGELCTFVQRNKVSVGDNAEILSPGHAGRRIVIGELYSEDGDAIESAPHPWMRFKLRVPFNIKRGDILRGC
ncbi:MAG: U32 family peptidase [Eubacteriales bacterium]